MAGPTFCPHSFACWGEIAQHCGYGFCRRRMSDTIQRETLAFYDYCLCVPPLKAEWGELSVRHFWLAAWWLASSRKGCTDISLLWRRYSDPMPKPRGLCPTMPQPGLNGIWGLVCFQKHKTMFIRFVATTKALSSAELTDFLLSFNTGECERNITDIIWSLQWLEICWSGSRAVIWWSPTPAISNHWGFESSTQPFLPLY